MVNEGGAVDESNGDVTFDVQAVLLGGVCAGTWYRQWTATDECGNVSYAEQFIPVVDETAPEFLFFPEDVTLELDDSGNADYAPEAVGGLPVASDNCAIYTSDLTPSFVDSEPMWLCGIEGQGSYQIERTWTVSDICGNVHNQVQVITLEDITAPTLEGDDDIDVACDAYDESTSYISASQDVRRLRIVMGNQRNRRRMRGACGPIRPCVHRHRRLWKRGDVHPVHHPGGRSGARVRGLPCRRDRGMWGGGVP